MALQPVTDHNDALATDLNQYRNHLQGASGSTDAYHFRSSGGADFLITLSDAVGARKFSIRDSGGNEVASIDSDGGFTAVDMTLTDATITELTAAVLNLTEYSENVSTVAAAGSTETIDVSAATVHDITLDENVTFTFSNPVATGRASSFTLILRQDGSGTNTVTWPASVKWAAGEAPTITADASAIDVLTFFTVDGGTEWLGFVSGQAMA